MEHDVELLEAAVLEVFRTVLRRPAMVADEDFFAAGGDSLLATDAVFEISNRAGTQVDPTLMFMYPTASALSHAIAESAAGTETSR